MQSATVKSRQIVRFSCEDVFRIRGTHREYSFGYWRAYEKVNEPELLVE